MVNNCNHKKGNVANDTFKESTRRYDADSALGTSRECVRILHGVAGAIPVFGNQIQSLLKIGLIIIENIQKIRDGRSMEAELARKIQSVLEIIVTALKNPKAIVTPNLQDDLARIEMALEDIEHFVRTQMDKRSIKRVFSSSSDYDKIVFYETKLDEAVKKLIVGSGIQTRLDVQALKETLQQNTDALQQSADVLQKSTNVLQGSTKELQGSANTLQGNANALQGSVTTLQGSANVLQGSTDDLTSLVRTIRDQLTTEFRAARADLLQVSKDLASDLQTGLKSLKADLKAEIYDLAIQSRNSTISPPKDPETIEMKPIATKGIDAEIDTKRHFKPKNENLASAEGEPGGGLDANGHVEEHNEASNTEQCANLIFGSAMFRRTFAPTDEMLHWQGMRSIMDYSEFFIYRQIVDTSTTDSVYKRALRRHRWTSCGDLRKKA
ncbi:hypothetical protein DFH11DRAFT_1581088 [Phellopilus nigrolimitatus]|nr:hypothetical protein DFH11DRAFT_1581088 [Phellopilus nigrolimitatus]